MPHLISESLRNCDADLREVLLSNVVLTGGTTLFSGFADRLATELTRNFPHVSTNPICMMSSYFLHSQKFMHLVTRLSGGTEAGWVVVFWQV